MTELNEAVQTSSAGSKAVEQPLLDSQDETSSSTQAPFDVYAPVERQKEGAQNAASKLGGSWWLELSALFLSLSSFIALLYLLFACDGQPISKWTRFPIALSAIISILAGISKASLAFVISMCLSQGKWNWVDRFAEPLIDFDRFDAARRGAWGSVRLLRSCLRRPHWTALGASTAIALLAYEPFLQAVVTLEDRATMVNGTQPAKTSPANTNETQTGLPVIGRSSLLDAGFWTGFGGGENGVSVIPFTGPNNTSLYIETSLSLDDIQEDMGMRSAVWNGFSPLISQQNLWPSFTCSSGNCSWDNFASLAVCSRCHDLSSHLEKTLGVSKIPDISLPGGWMDNDTAPPDVSNQGAEAHWGLTGRRMRFTKYSIPRSGLNLSNYDGKKRCKSQADNCPDTYLSVKVTTNPGHTISFQNSTSLLIAIQYIIANESWSDNRTTWEETRVTAHECGLYLCVNEYQDIVQQGTLQEKVLSSWTDKTPGSYSSDKKNVKEYLKWINNSLDMGPGWTRLSDLQITIPPRDYASRAANQTQQTFNVTQTAIMSFLGIFTQGFSFGPSDTTKFLVYPALGLYKPPGLMAGLGEFKNITAAIENIALSLTKWMRDREFDSNPTTGTATMMVVFSRVQWGFLVLPAVSLLTGLVFAGLSIWETHRLKRPVFKDSALATLACAPDGEFRLGLQQAAADGSLQVVGRKGRATLEYQDGFPRLIERKGEL